MGCPCLGLAPGSHPRPRCAHREGRPARDGAGCGGLLYELPSRAQPGHVVGPLRESDSAQVAPHVLCPPRGASHPRGRRHCRAPAWRQDHGQGLLSGCAALQQEAYHPLFRPEMGVDAAVGTHALELTGVGPAGSPDTEATLIVRERQCAQGRMVPPSAAGTSAEGTGGTKTHGTANKLGCRRCTCRPSLSVINLNASGRRSGGTNRGWRSNCTN
jgi:hypothetical protein